MTGRSSLLVTVCITAIFLAGTAQAKSGYANNGTINSARGCPSAKTCSIYAFTNYRWPIVNHHATLKFSINPIQPFLTQQQAEDGILAAAKTWANNDPVVIVNPPSTTNNVVTMGDGVNEIGWGSLPPTTLAQTDIRTRDGLVIEADIVLNLLYAWSWTPCSQRNGSCVDSPSIGGVAQPTYDIQDVLTHEFGHWLGLGHIQGNATTELTMNMTKFPGQRIADTLALGDILGLRALYRCTCKHPTVFEP